MNLTLIAAMDRGKAIGRQGTIPWHYPEDFAHFKRETIGATLIMGRSTWDSIGRPLPNRNTIVLTRSLTWRPVGFESEVSVATSMEDALSMAEAMGTRVMVAGGEQIYRLALPLASHQILTTIPVSVEDADTYYPDFSAEEWREERSVTSDEGLTYQWLERI